MKKTYYFWNEQGVLAGSFTLAEGQDELPNSTTVAPPELGEDYCAVWLGDSWVINRK